MATPHGEPTIESRLAYEGKIVNVRVDTVKLPSSTLAIREIVEHSECECVVPVDEKNNVVLVTQYRKPAEEELLEVPAGGVEPGELTQEAVRRELQEETGYTADDLAHLSSFWTTPGFCNELMHAYMATRLRPSKLVGDDDEDIQVVKVPLGNISAMIRRGEIKDAKSIASLLMVLHLDN